MPTASSGRCEIHFEDVGRGDCLLLGHSFLCSGAMWQEQLPVWSATHRVLNVDLRGHGRSSPFTERATITDMVTDMTSVLDAAGVERAVWVGLSMGGMIALRAALEAPERVRALVLLDTDAGSESAARRLEYSVLALTVRAIGIRPLLGTICRRMFGATTRRTRPALVAAWRRRFATVHVPSMLRCMSSLARRSSLLDRLSGITFPTLVIVGAEDVSLPPSRSQRIADGLPAASLQTVEHAGHLACLERPDEVTAHVSNFLSNLHAA